METQARLEIPESDTIIKIISEDSIRAIQIFLSLEHIILKTFLTSGQMKRMYIYLKYGFSLTEKSLQVKESVILFFSVSQTPEVIKSLALFSFSLSPNFERILYFLYNFILQ